MHTGGPVMMLLLQGHFREYLVYISSGHFTDAICHLTRCLHLLSLAACALQKSESIRKKYFKLMFSLLPSGSLPIRNNQEAGGKEQYVNMFSRWPCLCLPTASVWPDLRWDPMKPATTWSTATTVGIENDVSELWSSNPQLP